MANDKGQGRANPAGRLGVAEGALSYADKKELNHGITLKQIDKEDAQALFGAIRKMEQCQKRFTCIRKWQSLKCSGVTHD